ncbi:helix-turn-helix domain-containing protein [Phocaeicola plebeius]|jgi:transcriptional regulator with XRE-family HTH domain|uniref:helix-turn-helix domain-containing protein n=1 Tax=Phocaeicola plebeius TaxID=310297 RepID=UPI00195B38D2|nr:helix-turn-helix transcriptional regulator [Phocaeicola plebeius]MBM6845093.1 helix-turn-helix transcriptional regulator [Phocaeicola plebeius]
MKYRIQEICREKGIMMKDLAVQMGRTPESLSRSLSNGTTTKMLEEIANTLGVQVIELIDGYIPSSVNSQSLNSEVNGYVKVKGTLYEVHSFEDLEKLLKMKD